MKTNETIYTVVVTEDYDGNKGNPVNVESETFYTLEDAEKDFEKEMDKTISENGLTRLVELYEGDSDNPLENQLQSDTCFSESLPENAVLVFYNHVRYMNYSYAIEEVREPRYNEKDYSDLPYSVDYTNRTWCAVYKNGNELKEDFENGSGIFGKLNSGGKRVEEWLNENGFETGDMEAFYDIIIEERRIKDLINVDNDSDATENAKFRIKCSWNASEISSKDVKGIVHMNISMGCEASGSVRDGQWHSVLVEVVEEF